MEPTRDSYDPKNGKWTAAKPLSPDELARLEQAFAENFDPDCTLKCVRLARLKRPNPATGEPSALP